MNPKLANVTMGWTISIFDICITYFTEKIILEFEETHISADRKFADENSYCCKCKWLAFYENLCVHMWTRYRWHEKLIKYDIGRNKLLKTHKKANFNTTYTPHKTKQWVLNKRN